MNPIIAFNTISKQFSKHEAGLIKLEFDVNASAATTVYVQIHDWPNPIDLAAGLTVPANGAVPKKSWPTPAGAIDVYKEFKRGEMEFTYGCFVCVSTTQSTLTIGTLNNKFDSVAAELISTDIVGSEVNAQSVTHELVWTEASGATTAKRLVRIACTNLESTVAYLMVFAVDFASLVSGTSVPVLRPFKMNATGDGAGLDTILVSCGGVGNNNLEGIDFKLIDSSTHQGCTLAISSTPTVYTAVATGANFYAEYK